MFQKIAKHRANDASNDVHRPPLIQSNKTSNLRLPRVKRVCCDILARFEYRDVSRHGRRRARFGNERRTWRKFPTSAYQGLTSEPSLKYRIKWDVRSGREDLWLEMCGLGASSDSPLARPDPESKILADDQKKKKRLVSRVWNSRIPPFQGWREAQKARLSGGEVADANLLAVAVLFLLGGAWYLVVGTW